MASGDFHNSELGELRAGELPSNRLDQATPTGYPGESRRARNENDTNSNYEIGIMPRLGSIDELGRGYASRANTGFTAKIVLLAL